MGAEHSKGAPVDFEALQKKAVIFNRSEVKELYKKFCEADLDKDGFILPEEIVQLEKISMDEACASIAIMDTDGDGTVSFEEWLRFKEFISPFCSFKKRARILITLLDANGDGVVDLEEWKAYVHRLLPHIPMSKLGSLAQASFRDLTAKGTLTYDDVLVRRAVFTEMFNEIIQQTGRKE